MASKISVPNFNGDPKLLDFFFDQLRSYCSINKLSNDAVIHVLKDKLTDAALAYLIENKTLYNATDLDFIQREFQKFFGQGSYANFMSEFNNLKLLTGESIKNFAHRLNCIVPKAFPNLLDKDSLDSVKFPKFIDCLPNNIKTKLREENILQYDKAVERAHLLSEIYHESDSKACANNSNDAVLEKLESLTKQLNNFCLYESNDCKMINNVSHTRNQRNDRDFRNYRDNYKSRMPQRNQYNWKTKKIVVCQLCNKKNHDARSCFRWTRVQRENNARFNTNNVFRNLNQQ